MYEVAVFEVADVFPRRREDRPNVYVGWVSHNHLDAYISKVEDGKKGPDDIRGKVRGHLPELTQKYESRPTKDGAQDLKRKVTISLCNQGYRVIVGGLDVSIYVIELDPSMANKPITKAWLYVGSTGKSVIERYQEHVVGESGSQVTKDRCLSLRKDLSPDTTVRPTMRYDAEADVAHNLIDDGYDVYSDAIERKHRTQPGS